MRIADRGNENPPLGSCPSCAEQIPSRKLLIEYETSDGWTRMFAECPTCQTPVHPE